jgi:DNA primase
MANTTSYREFADQLLATADIVEVVEQYVELKRAGSNLKGLCPFHQEKTPSFNVHPGKQIYKCFGCGKGGDVIGFVREIERVGYAEALKILARRYSLEMPQFHTQGRSDEKIRWRETLSEAMEQATKYYEHRFAEETLGRQARTYIENRGLSPEVINAFRIGVIGDNWQDLTDHLKSRGYSEKTLLATGLAKENKNGGLYDYLRDRLIFPITNSQGSVIAFGGRIFSGDGPKYLNTAETELFHKGRELYGLYQARDALTRENRPAVLVEGYTDVIACHQAGQTSAVASMGTALTPEQARLIKRFTKQAVFLYDADEAGLKAIMRGLEVLVGAGLKVRVGHMPEGEDPDSLAKNQGPEALSRVIEEAQPFFEFLLDQARKRYDFSAPEERVNALEIFQPVLSALDEKLVRDGYVTKLASALGHEESELRTFLNRETARKRPFRRPEPQPEVSEDDRPEPSAPPMEDLEFADEFADAMLPPEIDDDETVAESALPVGADPPTGRERGLLRILIEHADARVIAQERLDCAWVENPLVRYWVKRLLELDGSVTDAWPALMATCKGHKDHESFLHDIVFTTDEPLGDDSVVILERLIGLMESDYRRMMSRMLVQKIADLGSNPAPDLLEEIKQNFERRIHARREATRLSDVRRI